MIYSNCDYLFPIQGTTLLDNVFQMVLFSWNGLTSSLYFFKASPNFKILIKSYFSKETSAFPC
jgi:hypothetical protein